MRAEIYKKIADRICVDFRNGKVLPPERSLAEYYACTRATIRAALHELSERGFLQSTPRCGHTLTGCSEEIVNTAPSRPWTVVMLIGAMKMKDTNTLDYLSGVIHAAGQHGINLVIREIPDDTILSNTPMLEKLHEGIHADGYLLAILSERIRGFLEDQFKPCVVMGANEVVDKLQKRRFIQIYLPMSGKVLLAIRTLLANGHRKILCVHGGEPVEPIRQDLKKNGIPLEHLDFISIPINPDPSTVSAGVAESIADAVRGHTAVLISYFSATAMKIYRLLTERGYRIPERLSMIFNSGRFDYFVNVYEIDNLFSSAADEGANCIHELVHQIENNDLQFGCRYTGFVYRQGNSVGPAMSPEEVAAYDKKFIHSK